MNWKAVLYGFLASIVIGLVSGLGLPLTDATLPAIGAGVTGLIAGAVAGYVNNWTLGSDALHGGVATVVGALVVALVLTFVGTLGAGVFGLGAGIALLVAVAIAAIPGAIGGAIGGYLNGGRRDDATRTTA
ncbi:DUF5518 domain-containing protein [Halopelagius longus]|uniref:DUF5518 domain-containing protein n=1 Tax=Halopelagius longus TaxID=1236180 RepID=A0A1H0YW73_9EURY|nr:DUF5518 domain-containing protein [Halopelagius longus]RDI72697.1 hypothetical protein DWB78_13735 [Halopelagius longus]SDQ19181.1 hypothetical protein SAMN05216278_0867 [Halopelagius longus]